MGRGLLFYALLFACCWGSASGCGSSECSFHSNKVTIDVGEYITLPSDESQTISCIASGTMDIGLVLDECRDSNNKRDDNDCTVYIVLLSPKQYTTFRSNSGSLDGLDLKGGVTHYEIDNTQKHNIFNTSVYFGQATEIHVVVGLLKKDDISSSQSIRVVTDISYSPPDTCIGSLSAFVFIIVGLILILVVGKVVYSIFGSKLRGVQSGLSNVVTDEDVESALDSNNLMEDEEDLPQEEKERRYQHTKKLLEDKSHSPWFLRPSAPPSLRKPYLHFLHRPKYTFSRYWLYNHHWFSLCVPGPDPVLSRFNKLFLALTLLMVRIFMLLVVSESMNSTSQTIATSESSTIGNVTARYLPILLLLYIIEYFLGELYEKLLVWKQRAEARSEAEGFNWRISSDSAAARVANIVLKHIIEISLAIITLAVVMSTFVLMTEITCEVFWQFFVGLLIIEFFKVIFPGIVFIWAIYFVLNSWGTPPTLENPWNDDEETFEESTPAWNASGDVLGDSDSD